MGRSARRSSWATLPLLFIILTTTAVQAQGDIDGVPICTEDEWQRYTTMCADDSLGSIVVWEDHRNGNGDIFAQRIGPVGQVLWQPGGVPVCDQIDDQGSGNYPHLAVTADGAGGAIIAWVDNRFDPNGDIYAQRIDRQGQTLWAAHGEVICDAADVQYLPVIVSDGAGGAVIAWNDSRTSGDSDIYVQRVDADGVALWAEDGVRAITALESDIHLPALAADGSGGALLTWMAAEGTDTGNIYAQRFDADGIQLWSAENGVTVCAASGFQSDPAVIADGQGGAIVAWWDERDGTSSGDGDIYVQRLAAGDGAEQWTPDGVALDSTHTADRLPFMTADGNGGALVAWSDHGTGDSDIFATRVASDGSLPWTPASKLVCNGANDQKYAKIVVDGQDGAILAWIDDRNGPDDFDIYGQRLDSEGNDLWEANGRAICTAVDHQATSSGWDPTSPALVYVPNRGAIVAWDDYRDDVNTETNIYAQGLNLVTGFGFGDLCQAPEVAIPDNAEEVTDTISVEFYSVPLDSIWIFVNVTHDDIGELFIEMESPGGTFVTLHNMSGGGQSSLFGWYDLNLFADGDLNDFDGEGSYGDWTLHVTDMVSGNLGTLHDWCLAFGRDAVADVPRSAELDFFGVRQAWPNPFNPRTTIQFELARATSLDLAVYDVQGRLVSTLVTGFMQAGPHQADWNGRDTSGRQVASGTYFARLQAGRQSSAVKLLLLK